METHDIILFSNFDQTKKWSEVPYKVEFKGNKARVISTETFSNGIKSRFNKLLVVGKTTSGYHYVLTVNGLKAFLISTYEITK